MTDTTPDYAGLIERLEARCSYGDARLTNPHDALSAEAATGFRTILESNKGMKLTLDVERQKIEYRDKLIERAEAKLAEAMKVIGALLACPSIADEDHSDPEWGCEETADAERAARKFLKENGNGE